MKGLVTARLIPIRDLPVEEHAFREWWRTRSRREKDRYIVYEHHNLILTAGKNAFLTSGINSSTLKQFAIGTGAFSWPLPGDTTLANEFFRTSVDTYTTVGNQITIETVLQTYEAVGTLTCAGLFGGSATSTPNSGTLMTEASFAFSKDNSHMLTNDWVIDVS